MDTEMTDRDVLDEINKKLDVLLETLNNLGTAAENLRSNPTVRAMMRNFGIEV